MASLEKESETINALNEALKLNPNLGARWWHYTVSLLSFDLLIGDPSAETPNIGISSSLTHEIKGPTSWENQKLRASVKIDPKTNDVVYELIDESVNFYLRSGFIQWVQNYDVLSNGGLAITNKKVNLE